PFSILIRFISHLRKLTIFSHEVTPQSLENSFNEHISFCLVKKIRLLIVPSGNSRRSAISLYIYPSRKKLNGILNSSFNKLISLIISWVKYKVSGAGKALSSGVTNFISV